MKMSAVENQIKEKINAREIVPSKASWDRLDAMLAIAEKPKRNFRWMYVAASFLGFLLMGTLYFNQNKESAIVVRDAITVRESKKDTQEIKTIPEKMHRSKKIEISQSVEKQIVSSEVIAKLDSNIVLSNKDSQVAVNEVIQEEQIAIINQKTEQPIQLQKSKYVNADELLASVDNTSAKREAISVGSNVKKANVKVNSNELLTQVDSELDLTFREKAIKTVSQNFKAVKLALSNRNSE